MCVQEISARNVRVCVRERCVVCVYVCVCVFERERECVGVDDCYLRIPLLLILHRFSSLPNKDLVC